MKKDPHPKMQVSSIFIAPAHPMIVVDAADCRFAASTVDSLVGIDQVPLYSIVIPF